jgi:thiamine pyrophosphokinase
MPSLRRALIIANGALPPRKLTRLLARRSGLVVCADGGANHALTLGIRPGVILGDLDSIRPKTLRAFRTVTLLRIADQESTDLEKAIRHCLKMGYNAIDIAGATGDRVDHTAGALGCLRRFAGRASLKLYDAVGSIETAGRSITLSTRKGEKISLIPLTRCSGVTTTNLRYPLKRGTLELGVREGISNEATARRIRLSVRRGTLLVQRFR